MTTTAVKLITAAEFARMPEPPDGSKQELVRGVIVSTPTPSFSPRSLSMYSRMLASFPGTTHPLRSRHRVESGLHTEQDPDTVRGPDVAYWSAERLPLEQTPEGYPDVAADLVVEVQSPSSRRRTTQEKIREYLNRGVRLDLGRGPGGTDGDSVSSAGRRTLALGRCDLDRRRCVTGFRVPRRGVLRVDQLAGGNGDVFRVSSS